MLEQLSLLRPTRLTMIHAEDIHIRLPSDSRQGAKLLLGSYFIQTVRLVYRYYRDINYM